MSLTKDQQFDQIASANRLKSEFIANVSHELRTPVHAIIGYTELLCDGAYGPMPEEQEQTIRFIQETSKDLLSLINNLLDVSRIESGRADLIISAFDLRDLVTEILHQLHPLSAGKNLTVTSQIVANTSLVRTDRGKLKQILVNLLGNAIKFTQTGSVTVTLSASDDDCPSPLTSKRPHFLISVTDTGPGIPAEQLENIFEKFYQADSTPSRPHEGTGLGLYITKHLVELLAGTIQVASTPGKGTTLTVTLPVNYEEFEAIRRLRKCIAGAVTVGNNARHVLAVSDNPDIARVLTDALGTTEYHVRVTPASSEAAGIARALRPLVILLDAEHSSPGCWQVFQEFKTDPATKDIPTIFLASNNHQGLGAPIGVTTPLDRQEVLRSIRNVTHTGKTTVLVVDDDAGFRDVLKLALTNEGYQVEEAVNGTEAIEKMTAHPPHLVLLDLRMPGMDGWHVMRHIAQDQRLKDIQVLVLSGIVLNKQELSNLESQSRGLIQKGDFKVADVLEKVADALEVN